MSVKLDQGSTGNVKVYDYNQSTVGSVVLIIQQLFEVVSYIITQWIQSKLNHEHLHKLTDRLQT